MIIWVLELIMMLLVVGVRLWPTVLMEKGSKQLLDFDFL